MVVCTLVVHGGGLYPDCGLYPGGAWLWFVPWWCMVVVCTLVVHGGGLYPGGVGCIQCVSMIG